MACCSKNNLKCFILTGVVLAALVAYLDLPPPPLQPNKIEYWGPSRIANASKPAGDDVTIRPFTITYDDKMIAKLRDELADIKWIEPLEGSNYRNGVNLRSFRKVMDYWRTKFDFKRAQQQINAFPHFKTEIEGLTIHFFRSSPKAAANEVKTYPLLLLHGWPASYVEFLEVASILSHPHDGIAFDVIVPSLPGYGYSDAPNRKGVDVIVIARIFKKLMTRLGFARFFVQGGDWGGSTAQAMALMYPENVRGVHLNFLVGDLTSVFSLVRQTMFTMFPSIFGDGPLPPCMNINPSEDIQTAFDESSHFHMHATKPDTFGLALMNSAVGLAAHVMEKYSTGSNRTFRDLEDGGFGSKIAVDKVLANVMVYYHSNSITSTMRLYKENVQSGVVFQLMRRPVLIPAAYAVFPNEAVCFPRMIVKGVLRNLTAMTYYDKGGHFAPMEQPALFSSDVRSFVKAVVQLYPE